LYPNGQRRKQNIQRAVIAGETPTKGIEVVLSVAGEPDNVLKWGSDLPSLLPYYKQAVRQAKADKRQDGRTRWVLLRQILVRETV
jgi:hypothetical protein